MTKKPDVHIVPRGTTWAVEQGGRIVSTHRTQHNAEDAGRRIARQDRTELVTHRPGGRIRDKDSFGNDPDPPKDEKH